MRRPSKTPVRTKERYILDSIVSIFKGGHWVEESPKAILSDSQEKMTQDMGGGVSAPENGSGGRTDGNPTSSRYMTIIGGQKYDEALLEERLYQDGDAHFVVGEGRGAEKSIPRPYFRTSVICVDHDRYGKNARKVNVEDVLCYAIDSPLLLVGSGERVKQARKWLERTKSRREVIELP